LACESDDAEAFDVLPDELFDQAAAEFEGPGVGVYACVDDFAD
jgi:hypothetical protein